MSARNAPRAGWVTVAAAAAELTKRGDQIDASNVSRYLARNPDVPQEKQGKFRYVELRALIAHRSSSLYVADKRDAREIEPSAAPRPRDHGADAESDAAAGGSELQQTNLAIRQLDLRRKQREDAVEAGQLVPAQDVQVVVASMLEAIAAELTRQETALTTKLGREAGAEIRKAHRAARAAAVARLIEAAKEHLNPAVPVLPGAPPAVQAITA